ncbi:hypothetical protein [Methylobacterium nigriterrae]|uniref:hypothetical protein n=1 Tax=Methylobacterium nigriterrae TaxID=3127512 RepID=UPI003013CFC7
MEYKHVPDGGYYPHEITISIAAYTAHIEASAFAGRFAKLLANDLPHELSFPSTLLGLDMATFLACYLMEKRYGEFLRKYGNLVRVRHDAEASTGAQTTFNVRFHYKRDAMLFKLTFGGG